MTCPVCAAPLDASPDGKHLRCKRCDRFFAAGSMEPVAVPVGVDPDAHAEVLGFAAPAFQLPPDPMEATRRALAEKAKNIGAHVDIAGVRIGVNRHGVGVNTDTAVKEAKKEVEKTVSGWIWGCVGTLIFGVLFAAAIVVIGAIVLMAVMAPGGSPADATGAAAWDGKAPYTCPANGNVTLSGVTANLPGQTAIEAGGNCVITIVDCTITAGVAVEAGGNAQVTISGGSLSGSENSVVAGGNSTVNASGVTTSGKVKKKGGAKVNGL